METPLHSNICRMFTFTLQAYTGCILLRQPVSLPADHPKNYDPSLGLVSGLVTPLIKRVSVIVDRSKNYHSYLGLDCGLVISLIKSTGFSSS